MKKRTIPTLIGLLLLMISLAFGVSLVSYRQIFRLGASAELAPKDVRISNLSDSSFTISWTTDKATSGFIKYGESQNSLGKVEKEQAAGESLTHLVRVTGLNPETTFFFKINSGGNDFDNNGIPWQVTTSPQGSQPVSNFIASGSILTASGKPAKNVLVYVSVNGSLFSTLTSENGSWLIPVYGAVDPTTTLLEINAQAGLGEIASAQIFLQSANPTPAIILGQVFDFKNLPPQTEVDVPQASLTTPEEKEEISGFNIPDQIAVADNKTVTLDNINEGEKIFSTTPEFFGRGPSNTTITITVESDPQTESITISPSGEWNWTPPAGLSEGTHKITLSWKDASGVTRTLTRTFVVQAAEGPAFEATPSATLTPAPSPVVTSTPEATLPPQPESGNLTPTLLLFIMGTGAITFSLLIWKSSIDF